MELRYERGFDGRRSRIGMQEPRTHRHPSRQFISRIKLPCQTCPMMKTSFCPQSPLTSPEAPPSVMLSSMRALLCSMIVLLSESTAAHQLMLCMTVMERISLYILHRGRQKLEAGLGVGRGLLHVLQVHGEAGARPCLRRPTLPDDQVN